MRPSKNSTPVVEKVANQLTDDVIKHTPLNEGESREDILTSIIGVLDDNYNWGGYQLCKELDYHYMWSIDTELINIFDRADHYSYEAIRDFTKIWVKDNNLQPGFSFGDEVYYRRACNEYPYIEIKKYSIVNFFHDTGEYLLNENLEQPLQSMKFIRGKLFCTGIIVGYENVW